jgi:hypothetical protein
MTEEYQIVDDGDRRYYSQIPNMIDDAELSPIAFRLYCHLKRVIGSSETGYCSQSIVTMAECCGLSNPTVVKAKAELSDAGLIRIHERRNKGGGMEGHTITLTNIWNINEEIYKRIKDQTLNFDELCKKFALSETSKDARIKNIYMVIKRICTRALKDIALKNTLKNNILEDLAAQPFAPAQPSLLDQDQPQAKQEIAIPPQPKPQPKAKPEKKRDPLLDNLAVKAYQTVCHITPNEVQRQLIADKVTDVQEWTKAITAWMAHGWSPRNVNGQVNYFETGTYKQNGNGGFKQSTTRQPEQYYGPSGEVITL